MNLIKKYRKYMRGRAWKKAQIKFNIEQGWMVAKPPFYVRYIKTLNTRFDLERRMWNTSFVIFDKIVFTIYRLRNPLTNILTTRYSIKLQ